VVGLGGRLGGRPVPVSAVCPCRADGGVDGEQVLAFAGDGDSALQLQQTVQEKQARKRKEILSPLIAATC